MLRNVSDESNNLAIQNCDERESAWNLPVVPQVSLSDSRLVLEVVLTFVVSYFWVLIFVRSGFLGLLVITKF